MKYDIILFDLDGTLTDSKPGILNSATYALKSFGIEMDDMGNLNKFIGPPIRDSFRNNFGLAEDDVEKAVAKYREYFSVTGMFENSVYDGIIDLLEQLKKSGVTLAIATSKVEFYAAKIAEHFNFKHYFTTISGCEMDGTGSSKKEVITAALDRLDLSRQKRVVMIGDREHDILGAKQTGITSIGITWGYGSHTELSAASANYIANSPKELIELL